MKRSSFLFRLFLLASLGLVAPGAQAVVLDFEDAPINQSLHTYAGFNWIHIDATDDQTFPGSGYEHGSVSGSRVIFSYMDDSYFERADLGQFNFLSAYLTAAWDASQLVTVEGLLGGSVLYSQSLTINNLSPTFATFNFLGVDRVHISGTAQQIAIDDLSYNLSVPEPRLRDFFASL